MAFLFLFLFALFSVLGLWGEPPATETSKRNVFPPGFLRRALVGCCWGSTSQQQRRSLLRKSSAAFCSFLLCCRLLGLQASTVLCCSVRLSLLPFSVLLLSSLLKRNVLPSANSRPPTAFANARFLTNSYGRLAQGIARNQAEPYWRFDQPVARASDPSLRNLAQHDPPDQTKCQLGFHSVYIPTRPKWYSHHCRPAS